MSNYLAQIDACQSIPLLDVMAKFNIQYPSYVGHIRCPFNAHSATGNTPSFKYYQNTGSFYCWGCHKGGRAIEFVMNMLNLSRGQTVVWLFEQFHLKIEPSQLIKKLDEIISTKDSVESSFNLIRKVTSLNIEDSSFDKLSTFVDNLYLSFMGLEKV